jgi:hypothetical protein
MTFGTEVVCDALYKMTMKCEKASEVTVGTYGQGYLLLGCPTRRARGYP